MTALYRKYLADVILWTALAPLAFFLRLDLGISSYLPGLVAYTLTGGLVKAVAVYAFGLHLPSWRWIGVRDLYGLLVAVGTATVVLMVGALVAPEAFDVPKSIPVIEGILAVIALGALRMSRRLYHERALRPAGEDRRRTLIVGAGDAGVLLARELMRHPEAGLVPAGFLDDDSAKLRGLRAGLPVFGRIDLLEAVVVDQRIQEVLFAMPSASGETVRAVATAARRAGVPGRTIPRLTDLASGRVQITQLRSIDLEDLLRREPIRLDAEPIRDYVGGKRVLVTGAGGSIGSEIVRQIAAFEPATILLLGRGENSVYIIDRELNERWPHLDRETLLCDVRDRHSLEAVFERYRPHVVFHAAAHKHVPLVEANPEQAVWNNVAGTRNVAELADEYGATHLVNVSTDKAVNPTNVMGASKRTAEMIVAGVGATSDCTMVSVRFGNVLGSRGSVVPLFRHQIAKGGPVTVTHPDMVRYFMTIPEAAQLVLQAGAFAEPSQVYVLDMGDPVRIADLARDVISLSGYEPGVDIEIRFTGTRPGEKLYEELLLAEEGIEPSPHEKIFVAKKAGAPADFAERVDALLAAAYEGTAEDIRAAFRGAVPTYQPEAAASVGSGRSSSGDGFAEPASTTL